MRVDIGFSDMREEDVLLFLENPGIVNLVAVSSDETAANLFTLLVFSICALPISLAAACAGWLMMHGVYRVPRRAAFLSHKAA